MFNARTAVGVAVVALSLAAAPPASGTAQRVGSAYVARVINDPAIPESSGLSRSTYGRPLLWTLNDNGDSARVFAIGTSGETKAVLRLRCATNIDFEDLSSGPDHTLWVGDVGDNYKTRSVIQVYRFVEPREVASGEVKCKRYDLVYPDGAHDCEALFVHPRYGRVVWLATKDVAGGRIYRAPKALSQTHPNQLVVVGQAPEVVTAGTWAPRGRRFALSTYTDAYVYRRSDLALINSFALPTTYNGRTLQGETLAYTRRGKALLRGSEGLPSPIFRIPLR